MSEKNIKLELALDIIKNLDDKPTQTEWIDEAIQKLEAVKHIRQNIPF